MRSFFKMGDRPLLPQMIKFKGLTVLQMGLLRVPARRDTQKGLNRHYRSQGFTGKRRNPARVLSCLGLTTIFYIPK